jgi:TRAP-type C4-dicarboxylate transport system substrate-binding protein
MWMEKMRQGAKKIAKKTDNRIRFKFYPGGVMGSDKDVFRKMRINQLQGGTFPGGTLSKFFPGCCIYTQLMKFNSIKEVDYVRQYMDKYIIDGLEKAGLVTFGLASGGFAYIMSTSPIESVKDLHKQKLWIPDDDPASKGAVDVFGITPIPLSLVNVKPSMQAGVINTIATSPVGAIILQWHTQVKYLTDMPFIYLYAALAINKKIFFKIPKMDREIIRNEMTKVFHEIGIQNDLDNAKALETLKNQGIKFILPSKNSLKEWHLKAEAASAALIKSGILTKDITDTLDRYLADYHSKNKKTN